MSGVRPAPWEVLHGYCHQARKEKFVVVVRLLPESFLGFFVNSRIHPFEEARPKLKARNILITVDDYEFLEWDSYVNTNQATMFSYWQHLTSRGFLSVADCARVRASIETNAQMTSHEIDVLLGRV